MTSKREQKDSSNDLDRRVSQAYRGLANEHAPERLDDAILGEAARAVRTPYSRSIRWTRPLAWAAVVTLCLAITLQLSQVPTPDDVLVAPRATLPERDFASEKAAESFDSESAAPGSSNTTAETAREQLAGSGRSLVPVAVEDEPTATMQDAVSNDRTDAAAAAKRAPAAAEFKLEDADMLERAEEIMRLQSGPNQRSAQIAAPALATAQVMQAEAAPDCDVAARSTPENWLVCITQLEEAGQIEAVKRQRELLAATFPEFELP